MKTDRFDRQFILLTRVVALLQIASATASAAAAAAAAAAAGPAYKLTDLGDLGGGYSIGLGINTSGQVTGASDTSGGATHAFLYDGTMHDLGTLGGSDSQGFAINASGQVVGWSFTAGNAERHAFLYDGVMHDLGTLDGTTFCSGLGINDSGRVSGYTFTRAFIYDGAMHDIGNLGGTTAYGYSINASGQVAGGSKIAGDAATHATLWTPTTPNGNTGTLKDLGTLGGTNSAAHGINAVGWVSGQSDIAGDTATHAFLYDGVMHDLGSLGGRETFGQGMNYGGQVVGTSYLPGNALQDAFLYSPGSGMVDLNTLIDPRSHFQLTYANAINDAGQITGGGSHAYLLTPVPEPGAGLMVITGALSLMRRRR